MADLLSAIQGNTQSSTAPQGQTNQTQGLADLLRAKSGKAGVGPSTALSNQQEQSAVSQGNQQLQGVQQQSNLQTQGQQQQMAGVQQQTQAQLTGIGQERQQNTQQTNIKTSDMLQNLEQQKGKISQDQYAAQMAQVGQNMRLDNQKYTDQLALEGDRARLNDSNSFKENLQQATFNDLQGVLQKQLGDAAVLDQNANTFSMKMGTLKTDDAYNMFQSAMQNEKDRAIWTAAGSLGGTGASAYGASQDKKAASATPESKGAV